MTSNERSTSDHSEREHVISIAADGSFRFVHNQDIATALSTATTTQTKRRASHVEPVNPVLRWMFHSIRSRVSDDSAAAELTRKFPCRWRARIFDGPTLGPFNNRAAAIAAEVEWINKHKV